MRLRHIEIFNAVLAAGSISGAARLLNLTQPSVSRTLQHAEVQLGLPLFHRTKGRLVPTDEALALAPHIDRLFQQLDEVQRLAGNLKAGRGAQALRVLTSATLSQHIIPQAVDLFRIRKPGVPVSISSVGSAQLVAGLALQEADVGLLLSVLSHPALSAECLARGDMVCVVSKEAPWARRLAAGPVALSALATEPVIGLAANDPIGRLLQQACRDAGVQLQSEVTVQNYHAALAFAHRGTGMAIVDSFTALSADLDKVVVRSIAPHIPISLQAMRPRGKAPLASLPAFLDCVREASGNDHAGAAP